ncbi:MAG: beta-N-acetylhexosaminidase [Pseudomonadota bacterium]
MSSAAIFGCSGTQLTADERAFFADADPWGFILFARNVDTPDQLRTLIEDLRSCIGRSNAPVLIDQEGGRVQRMGPPHWPVYPKAADLASLYDETPEDAARAVWLMSRLHAFDLSAVGINVDCLPLLDVPIEGASAIIGDRAYGMTVDRVSELGAAACEGLLAGGVLPVVKHIPGHGRAGVDSHLELPRVVASRDELDRTDFEPFRRLNHHALGMTAHIVYEAVDPDAPATLSKRVVEEVIRDFIGFDGLLMTDDLSMHALSGDFGTRTERAFAAGCDVVLHCNGEMAEMAAVANALRPLDDDGARRAKAAMNIVASEAADDDEAALREEFQALVSRTRR